MSEIIPSLIGKLSINPGHSASLSTSGTVSGTLSSVGGLSGTVSRELKYDTYYEGEYVVIPKVAEDQTLATMDKVMRADVEVKEVPVARVSNPAGGMTVVIGG